MILPKDGSDVFNHQDFEKMETNVQSRAGLDGRGSDIGKGKPVAEDWMRHEGTDGNGGSRCSVKFKITIDLVESDTQIRLQITKTQTLQP